jgi:thiol-disulfide isomerase/thioredoxin
MALRKYKSVIPFVATMSIFWALATSQIAAAGELSQLATGAMANFNAVPKPLPVPVIKFRDNRGQLQDLSLARGKVILLNFWATWCGPCRREMPDLDALQARLGGPKFIVMAISSDRQGLEVIAKFYRQYKIKHLAIFNDKSSKATRAFKVYGLPTSVLVDGRGRELGRLVGPAEWNSEQAVALIKAAIAGDGT